MNAVINRWWGWQRQKAAAARHGLTTYPICHRQVGTQPCCCGQLGCPEIPQATYCQQRISLVRYLLVSYCKKHR